MMRKTTGRVIAMGTAIGVAVLATSASGLVSSRPPALPPSRPAVAIRDANIAFYQSRVARDPYGARDRAMLGALYLARGREQGSEADLHRAEALARESYHARSARNGDALSILAGSLLAQHRFLEAWDVAQELVQRDSTAVARATLGEIALELGRYDAADSWFGGLSLERESPAIAPRYARWLELNGHAGAARELLEAVRSKLSEGFRVPPEQLAWFDLRLGDLAARNGRPDLAARAYDRGLKLVPEDHRLLTAQAELALARGSPAVAIELGEQALARQFDPATLALLCRASLAQADTAAATDYTRVMEIAVSRQPQGFHRGWALFLLDRGRRVPEMRRRAVEDLRHRKDVYGYDLAAWALYRAGQPTAALPLADSALARGTRDAMLFYHAGMIALATGDTTLAATRLRQAQDINPGYRPTVDRQER